MNLVQTLKTLGPGLIYAGAAIGVSHLVQSTRAGANFGFQLVWVVLLANLIKFPFFEMGPRYVAATGKSLLHGYKKLGDWSLILFILMTFGTMFIIQAAVTVVTAGLASEIFGLTMPLWGWTFMLLSICGTILVVGQYTILDKVVKGIIITLAITTIVALAFSVFGTPVKYEDKMAIFDWGTSVHIFFVIALVGWMPAPMDISVWYSIWGVEKNQELKEERSLKSSLFDFKIGYWGTAILAVGFVSLGALFMYGTGEEFSPKAAKFAGQLIDLYTGSIGNWAYIIIAIAAFTTMFSTTLTCFDAFPRALNEAFGYMGNKDMASKKNYTIWLVVTALGTMVIVLFLLKNMKALVDLATTISFVTAPVIAILNYMVISNKDIPEEFRPKGFTLWVSWAGMVFLTLFSLFFLYYKYLS